MTFSFLIENFSFFDENAQIFWTKVDEIKSKELTSLANIFSSCCWPSTEIRQTGDEVWKFWPFYTSTISSSSGGGWGGAAQCPISNTLCPAQVSQSGLAWHASYPLRGKFVRTLKTQLKQGKIEHNKNNYCCITIDWFYMFNSVVKCN